MDAVHILKYVIRLEPPTDKKCKFLFEIGRLAKKRTIKKLQ